MPESHLIEIPSPNGQHMACLHWAGEIPFGPAYYKLEIDGKTLRRRHFGERYLWSSDSNYFAIEEWLTTDRAKGPLTQLVILDILNGVEYQLAKTHKGFIKPIQFDDRQILVEKQFYAQEGLRTEEIRLAEPNMWNKRSISNINMTSTGGMFVKLRKTKGRLLGGCTGLALGACISYAFWGDVMWNRGVPSGIPILLGTVIGTFLGAVAIDEPFPEERRFSETIGKVIIGGTKGLITGSIIGALLGGLCAMALWYFSLAKASLSLLLFFFGLSVGGLLGFMSSASTSYESKNNHANDAR
jgi:hypothetical protein